MSKKDDIEFVVSLKPETTIALDVDLGVEGWRVFAEHGRAMLSAQLLEFTVVQLAHQDRKTPTGFERAMRQVDGLLKQPTGDQIKGLKDVDPDLRDELTLAVDVRNKLAHDSLTTYRVDVAVRGEAAHEEARAMFRAIALFLDSVRERLEEIANDRLEGVDDLDDEEMKPLMESLTSWADSATFADDPSSGDPESDSGPEAERVS